MRSAFSLLYNAHPLYQEVIGHNTPRLPLDMEYSIYDTPLENYENTDPRSISDTDRLDYLIKNPWGVYWDADTVYLKDIDFNLKPDRLYMQYRMGKFDMSVIFGNGCLELLKYIRSKFDPSRPIKWYTELINGELQNEIEKIPAGYFNHLGLNSVLKRVKEGELMGGYGYSVSKINGELKLRIR